MRQVFEDLCFGLGAVQGFQPRSFLWLGGADECQGLLGEEVAGQVVVDLSRGWYLLASSVASMVDSKEASSQ